LGLWEEKVQEEAKESVKSGRLEPRGAGRTGSGPARPGINAVEGAAASGLEKRAASRSLALPPRPPLRVWGAGARLRVLGPFLAGCL
jgi:hypothetical protein